MAPAEENLNTLYLYNYIRGRLVNIPAVGTGAILLSLYSGSGDDSEPSGSKLYLPAGGGLATAGDINVTGAYVSTGIYSASFAVTAAATPLSTLYDVWHSGGVEFNTGSITQLIDTLLILKTLKSHIPLSTQEDLDFLFARKTGAQRCIRLQMQLHKL